jgi:hypothetical protein
MHSSLLYSAAMKPVGLLFFLLVAGVSFCFSQNCQTAPAVPAGQLKLASGELIQEHDGVASVNGGQAVYAKIKNANQADLSYWVAVEVLSADTKRYETNCRYEGKLAPNTSDVVLGSSSVEPPVQWRVSVTLGPDDSNEGLLLRYEVYSNPKKNLPKQ